jgi:hypothetical protein
VPRAPLPEASVTAFRVMSTPPRRALPLRPRSYGLMRQATPLHHNFVLPHLYPVVCAGCCQPLLGGGLSRRSLCKSVPGCLGHDPGGASGARACFFPDVVGLPYVPPIGRLPASIRSRDCTAEGVSRSSPFLPFRPPGLFATQVSPTATAHNRRAAVTFPSEQNLCCYLHRHRIC